MSFNYVAIMLNWTIFYCKFTEQKKAGMPSLESVHIHIGSTLACFLLYVLIKEGEEVKEVWKEHLWAPQ